MLFFFFFGGFSFFFGDFGDRVFYDWSSNGVFLDGSSGSRVYGYRFRLDEVIVVSDVMVYGEWCKG